MIVGQVHLYKTRRVGMLQQQKDTEDVALVSLSGETPIEVLRSLRVMIDTLEQEMSAQEAAKKDNPVKPEKVVTRGRRGRPIEDDEDDEIEDEDEDEGPSIGAQRV